MSALSYRDSAGQWVALPVAAGPAGPAGAPGAVGPLVLSVDAGNIATTGTDGRLFVPAGGGLDPATASALYVDVPGDEMTGELQVPDQVAVKPTDPRTAAAKGYVDQVLTVSDNDPVLGILVRPVRDGQLWYVVEDQP